MQMHPVIIRCFWNKGEESITPLQGKGLWESLSWAWVWSWDWIRNRNPPGDIKEACAKAQLPEVTAIRDNCKKQTCPNDFWSRSKIPKLLAFPWEGFCWWMRPLPDLPLYWFTRCGPFMLKPGQSKAKWDSLVPLLLSPCLVDTYEWAQSWD